MDPVAGCFCWYWAGAASGCGGGYFRGFLLVTRCVAAGGFLAVGCGFAVVYWGGDCGWWCGVVKSRIRGLVEWSKKTVDKWEGARVRRGPFVGGSCVLFLSVYFYRRLCWRLGGFMFALFRMAGDEDEELRALLGEYGVTGDVPAGEGAYGRVYFGVAEGRPVAIKIEGRESGSAEYAVLDRLRTMRAGAPGAIKRHVPVVYRVGCGGAFCYYVMEILRPLDRGIARDLVGTDWSADVESGVKGLRFRLDADVSGIADVQHAVLVGGSSGEKLLDAGLVAGAFAEWFGRNGRAAAAVFGGDRGGLNSFRTDLERAITGVLVSLGGEFGRGGRASVGDIASLLGGRVRSALSGRARVAARLLEGKYPELVFAIVRAGWLPKFHPGRAGDDVVGPYETLSRSTEALDSDSDRRSLRETLDWMREGGVLSGDIHEDNIMERPGTGEWVLIDYGLYRFMNEDE